MPKRKNPHSEYPPKTTVLDEKCNMERLEWCRELQDVNIQTVESMTKRLEKKTSEIRTTYASNEGPETYMARQYGGSFQNCEKFILRLCLHELYREVDIVNAMPTILTQLAQTHNIPLPTIATKYASIGGREQVFAQIRTQYPTLDVSDKTLKAMFLAGMTSGKHTSVASQHRNGTHLTSPITSLAEWENCWAGVCRSLQALDKFSQFRFTEWQRALSMIYQEAENEIIHHLIEFFADSGIKTGVMRFDSILIQTRNELTQETLSKAEKYVKDCSGFQVSLKESDLTPTEADKSRYYGPKDLFRLTPMKQIFYLLTREGQLNNYKRLDGYAMKPHEAIPGVFVKFEESHRYIDRVLGDYRVFQECKMENIQKWFDTIATRPFFDLVYRSDIRSDVISFQNGYWDLNTLDFHEWKNVKSAPLTDHYFETRYTEDDKPTPIWTTLLSHQLPPAEVHFLEVMIGRLFYPVAAYDKWTVCSMLRGDANTVLF